MQRKCNYCDGVVTGDETKCPFCGASLPPIVEKDPQPQPAPQPIYVQAQGSAAPRTNAAWPTKNKIVFGVLAIILGGLGIHYFYVGKIGLGILCLIFCWTWIPEVVGIVVGIIALVSSDEKFGEKYCVNVE